MSAQVSVMARLNWADQVDAAMLRGNSPYNCLDVLRWMREGNATFGISGDMTGSVWFRPDGVAEICHIAGAWNDKDADWLYRCLMRAVRRRGLVEWTWNGRRGWRRFLRSKGWI